MAKNQNNNVAPATQKTEPGAKKDALATALAQIEKQFGKGAIMKLGDNTAMQVDAISTGSLGLDLALGVGGVPRGQGDLVDYENVKMRLATLPMLSLPQPWLAG